MVKQVISYFYYITEAEVLRKIIFRAEHKKQIIMLNSQKMISHINQDISSSSKALREKAHFKEDSLHSCVGFFKHSNWINSHFTWEASPCLF